LVADVVKTHLAGDSHKTHLYKKPYTMRINALHMPHSYQPPKFQQFDGKRNTEEHVTQFIETYNGVGTEGDL